MSINVPLIAFNDVYRVSQRYVAQPGAPADPKGDDPEATINVGQYAQLLYGVRDKWATQDDGKTKDGLVLFAGDVFSPSVESSVTRGSHMVPVLNALKIDCSVTGNHDFDFGYPHLQKLAGATHFPWLLSNVIESTTGKTPEPLQRFWVTERCGVRIGVIGLVEEDWIATIPSWPSTFRYRQMNEVAIELSKELRDPNGPHRVEIIIALTHCRIPNDIKLCNDLGAVADKPGVENEHGIDVVIGGHDHVYYIGKGAQWEGFRGDQNAGTAQDQGVRLIKSGTDFRDLSDALMQLSPPNPNTVRRRLITTLTGKHLYVTPSSPENPEVARMVDRLLATVNKTLKHPVCYTVVPVDARSEVVRTRESGLGNWAADVLMHAYDESLVDGNQVEFDKDPSKMKDPGAADAVILCGGTLRGDSQYGPGTVTLGDILEIFPFDDAVVCLEIDGKGIWDTMESALFKWPAQEGRFPIVGGMAVEWDHEKPPGQRVLSIHLTIPSREHDEITNPRDFVEFAEHPDGTRLEVKLPPVQLGEPIPNAAGGRQYRVITREYMAEGFDGFEALKNRRMIIDHENGQTMSSIIRSFLLGSAYIYRHKQLTDAHHQFLSAKTREVLQRAHDIHTGSGSPRASLDMPSPVRASAFALAQHLEQAQVDVSVTEVERHWSLLRRHVVNHDWVSIREALHIAKHEHMASVDYCEGEKLRHFDSPGARSRPPSTAGSSGANSGANLASLSSTTPAAGTSVSTPPTTAPPSRLPTPAMTPGILVTDKRRAELKALDENLPIVCPLVDGRMRDVSEEAPECQVPGVDDRKPTPPKWVDGVRASELGL